MSKKRELAEMAERLYVIEQMTVNEIADKLQICEKSVRNWMHEFGWKKKRTDLVNSKSAFHEDLFSFARKLMASIQLDMDREEKIDPGRLYAFTKMLPLITKVKDYEDTVVKDKANKKNDKSEGLTPDFVKMVQKEILGWTPADNDNENEQ